MSFRAGPLVGGVGASTVSQMWFADFAATDAPVIGETIMFVSAG